MTETSGEETSDPVRGLLSADEVRLAQILDDDDKPAGVASVPPPDLTRHCLVSAATGAGKSQTAVSAILSAHAATDTATIGIDPDGAWARDVARSLYALRSDDATEADVAVGDDDAFSDVLYFDASEHVPAVKFFDVSQGIAAGRDRARVVQDVTSQLIGIVDELLPAGAETVRARDLVQYLVYALFDPVHGSDSYGIDSLAEAAYDLRQTQETPAVSPEWLADALTNLERGPAHQQDAVYEAVVTRIEKLAANPYVRPMFTETEAASFSFSDILNEDALVLFDLGDLADRGTVVVSNVIMSLLWRALSRRAAQRVPEEPTPPTVLTFIDEVPAIAIEGQLQSLLDMGRGLGFGLTVLMQYPQQLRTETSETAYLSAINNCQTVLAGGHTTIDALPAAFVDHEHSVKDIKRDLRTMPQDRFLFKPATSFGEEPSRPDVVQNLPLAPGHPEADQPLTPGEREAFTAALRATKDRTAAEFGAPYEPFTAAAFATADRDATTSTTADGTTTMSFPTTFGFLQEELPGQVTWDHEAEQLVCASCDTAHDASLDGLIDAINCHGSVAGRDAAEIPPVRLGLTVSQETVADSRFSIKQLAFCQLVYNATLQRFHPAEYDIVHDSMTALRNAVGLSASDVDPLIEAGKLAETDRPHKLYWIPDDEFRRDVLNERYERGETYGAGIGDINESPVHVLMVEAARRYYKLNYVADPDSPIERIEPYYEPDITVDTDGAAGGQPRRLDLAGLTADGEVALAAEAERVNNDAHEAAPKDFDLIEAVNPQHHHWIVKNRDAGHDVLKALSNPSDRLADTTPRIEYAAGSTGELERALNDDDAIDRMFTARDLLNKVPDDRALPPE